jgi:hypothetical protein
VSEYQYYEFLAVDRPLDERQRGELRALSTRAQITATSFVNEYHWGSFRGNPSAMMERYFDAFLYLANWGTRHLMIRLPRGLLGLTVAERYCSGDAASAWAAGDNVILSLSSDEDPDDFWEEGQERLASIVGVRSELAAGDLRFLYLAWLLSVRSDEVDDEELEPPVPPNLRTLSAPLRAAVDFLRIDEDLLTVAAMPSAEVKRTPESQAELATWIEGLPSAEKDLLLVQSARGEGPQVQAVLQQRFRTRRSAGETPSERGKRTAGELWKAACSLREEQERAEVERLVQERVRQARATAAAYEKRLEELAPRQEQAWRQVSALIDTRKPREYDQAVTILKDLRALGEREGGAEAFAERFLRLREQHLRKPSLLQRFDKAGLQL